MTLCSSYIDVAVALPVYHTFTYCVPENLSPFISPGKRVLAPFGERRVTGYVLDTCEPHDSKEIRHIYDVLDEEPLFPLSMIPFFNWIADYYFHPIGEVIKSALPGGLTLYDYTAIEITEDGDRALERDSVTAIERELLFRLRSGSLRIRDFRKTFEGKAPSSLIRILENRGWVKRKKVLSAAKTRPKMDRFVSLTKSDIPVDGFSPARKKIIDVLKREGEIPVAHLKKWVSTSSRLIKPMAEAGQLQVYEKRVYRDPFGEPISSDAVPVLTQEQDQVVSRVSETVGKGFSTFLLTGVTGSGKTEVYMQLAETVLKRGHAVLVLVPEIALMSQMERRFRARFGACVAVLHSGLSAGERLDQWMRILRGEATIAVGARSAIFAPFEEIGLIIVDEEHDTSYKQESSLRYNARDLAVVRAKQDNAIALLGSATPSIQSYHNVTTRKFTEVTLKNRIEERPLPEISIVDLSKNRDLRGMGRFLSRELIDGMKDTLDRDEQVLLFLNRRGFASFTVCAECGEAMRCKNCDISLTLHRKANAYKCHYCGFSRAFGTKCSACGSPNIKLLGMGTEKIEDAIKAFFPDARVARMDRDTTTRKGSILQILKGLRNRTIDILVGTQIVAKGHDFPNITLVGIICADLSLSFPDFRAGERTFQIIAQVAGRAGRGDRPGRVILQTYNPSHFSILSAKNQDFRTFFKWEIKYRKELNYPPFSRMVQLKIFGKDREKTERHALKMGDICQGLKKNNGSYSEFVEILGPIEAPLQRIAKQYRWQILLKSLNVKTLHGFIRQLLFENAVLFSSRHVKAVIDVDPFFMM
ncbi:MAG: primosomal protein N' [Deltaproteobacteria bacterium]|nr:primosomal protein N' [Deltaproteobacteria bacterium]